MSIFIDRWKKFRLSNSFELPYFYSSYLFACMNFDRICVNASVDVVVVAVVTSGVAYQLSLSISLSRINLLSRKMENESESYFYELCKRIQNTISYITLLLNCRKIISFYYAAKVVCIFNNKTHSFGLVWF